MQNITVKTPAEIADAGKIRTGGACRIARSAPPKIADAGKVRTGGACRILRG
jgi:hypothetical protein